MANPARIAAQAWAESDWLQIPEEFLGALKRGREGGLPRIEKEIRELFEADDPQKIIKGLDDLRSVRLLLRLLKEKSQLYKGLESILDPRATYFRDSTLNKLYFIYLRRVGRPVPPAEWARTTESLAAISSLRRALGDDYRAVLRRRAKRKPITVGDVPDLLDPAAWRRWTERILERPDLLFRKLDKLRAAAPPPMVQALAAKPTSDLARKKRVGIGHWNILKGNVGEILTHSRQMEHLAEYAKQLGKGELKGYDEVLLLTDVRYTFLDAKGVRRVNKEFSDNMIVARTKDGHVKVLHVFEVKSGRDGAFEARKQLFENLESKEAIGIHVPRDAPRYRADGSLADEPPADMNLGYVEYDPDLPGFVKRHPEAAGTVHGLFEANKTTYAPSDQLKLDIEDGLQTAGKRKTSESLGLAWDELESLTALLFGTDLFKSAL